MIGYSFIFIFLKQVCLNCIIFDCHISDYKATYFFCFDMLEKSNTGVKTQDKRKPAILRSLTACMAMKHSLCGARQPLTMGCTSCCDPARLLTKLLAAHQFYFLCVCVP